MLKQTAHRLVWIVFATAACQGDQQGEPTEREGSELLALIDATPCDSAVAPTPAPMALAFTGRDETEKEAHDCERLVIEHRYGPLVGIFPFDSNLQLDDSQFAEWTPVASVFNWDSESYDSLRIGAGGHCLFLRNAEEGWQAHIDPGGNCRARSLRRDIEPNLQVIAQTYEGPDTPMKNRPIYPRTARFRWHAANRRHYIGIKCGENWCSVGDAASLPSASSITGPLTSNMPGYFDEQPMAIAHDGVLSVGPVARIEPMESLQLVGIDPTLRKRDVAYARVLVDTVGVNPESIDSLAVPMRLGSLPSVTTGIGAHLVMKVSNRSASARRPGGTAVKVLGFGRLEAREHAAPGTVRWRWREPPTAGSRVGLHWDSASATPADSAVRAADEALFGYSAAAAAWIPCQVDNCCTAVW